MMMIIIKVLIIIISLLCTSSLISRVHPRLVQSLTFRQSIIRTTTTSTTSSTSLSSSSSSSSLSSLSSSKILSNDNQYQLPLRYDYKKIESYYKARPLLLINRLVLLIETLITFIIEYLTTQSIASVALKYSQRAIYLGPLWIKIGQVLASRVDLIGYDASKHLEVLTDAVPETFSIEEARLIIQEDFKDNPIAQELLINLSNETVACASLAQVYKSKLTDIGEVAVKIQRPNIRDVISADFIFARFIANILSNAGIVQSDLIGAVDEYGSRLYEEIDYINEKNNIIKFNELYDNDIGTAAKTLPKPGLCLPKAISRLCSNRIITMTWINCTKLNDNNNQLTSQDLPLVKLGIRSTLSQLLETGILHADQVIYFINFFNTPPL